jgi:hypothetical protein
VSGNDSPCSGDAAWCLPLNILLCFF